MTDLMTGDANDVVRNPSVCHGCGEHFVSGDQMTSNWTNVGEQGVAERYWHQRCWERHEAEVISSRAESLR